MGRYDVATIAAVVMAGLIIAERGSRDTYADQAVRAVRIAKTILAASAADFSTDSAVTDAAIADAGGEMGGVHP